MKKQGKECVQDTCPHEEIATTYVECGDVYYNTKEHKVKDYDTNGLGFHYLSGGYCVDCDKQLTPEDLVKLGVCAVYDVDFKLLAETKEHAERFNFNSKMGRITNWQAEQLEEEND